MAVSGIDYPASVRFVQLRYGAPRPVDEEEKVAFNRSGALLTLVDQGVIALNVTAAGDVDGDGFGDLLLRTEDCAHGTLPEQLVDAIAVGDDRTHEECGWRRVGVGGRRLGVL